MDLSSDRPGHVTWLEKRRRRVEVVRRRTALVACALTLLAATGCTPWGPINSYYNGNRVVSANGFSYIDPQAAHDIIQLSDTRNDGNTVYAHAYFNYYETHYDSILGTYTGGWQTEGDYSTPEIANTTRTYTYYNNLRSQWSAVRVESSACAQMGWPVPDSCSGHAFVTFSY